MKYLLSILAAVFVIKAEAQSINIKSQQNSNISVVAVHDTTPGSISTSNVRDLIYIYSKQGEKIGYIECNIVRPSIIELYAPGMNPIYKFDSEEKCLSSIAAIEAAVAEGRTVGIAIDTFSKSIKEINYYNSCK